MEDVTANKSQLLSPIRTMPLSVRDTDQRASMFRKKILDSFNDPEPQKFLAPG
jgi:hypothetical protein